MEGRRRSKLNVLRIVLSKRADQMLRPLRWRARQRRWVPLPLKPKLED
jgi:hypothetical protein